MNRVMRTLLEGKDGSWLGSVERSARSLDGDDAGEHLLMLGMFRLS